MNPGDYIALAGLLLVIITMWIRLNIKITEINAKVEANMKKMEEHIRWGESEQEKNEVRFDKLQEENKETYKELTTKMDLLIERFNEFKVYCVQNFKN